MSVAPMPTAKDIFQPDIHRDFESKGDGRYVLRVPAYGLTFDLDRLRRNTWGEQIGELAVWCELAGARTTNGEPMSLADFNLSTTRSRHDRAKVLERQARTDQVDFVSILETFCQKVLAAERRGNPAVLLRDLPKPATIEPFHVAGIQLPRHHPSVAFGDGGDGKSYVGLYVAGELATRGLNVGVFDWELSGDDWRERLERVYQQRMPAVHYVRCDRPLIYEVDRLKRIARDERFDYAIYDSVAFACDGPPEAAECAGEYFRAVRQIGVGSLHIAHISKAEGGDQKPFGSAFWHNGFRATWFVKRAATSSDGRVITVGLFPRKANLGPLGAASGLEIAFSDEQTTFKHVNLATVEDLADRLPLWQRMASLLRNGALTMAEIAEELDAKPDTVKRTVDRTKRLFIRVPGSDGKIRIGLVERTAA